MLLQAATRCVPDLQAGVVVAKLREAGLEARI
jgi:hypothetical protein